MQAQKHPPKKRRIHKTVNEWTKFSSKNTAARPEIPVTIIFFFPIWDAKNPLGMANKTKLNEKKVREKEDWSFESPRWFFP